MMRIVVEAVFRGASTAHRIDEYEYSSNIRAKTQNINLYSYSVNREELDESNSE